LVRTKEGAELRARTIVWSAGVKTNPLLATIDLPKAKDGRLLVDARLRADGRDDVLSLGDAAAFDYQGRPLPQLAQVAVMEAKAAARNVAALVRGQPAVPYVYRRKGDHIALGLRRQASFIALALRGDPPFAFDWEATHALNARVAARGLPSKALVRRELHKGRSRLMSQLGGLDDQSLHRLALTYQEHRFDVERLVRRVVLPHLRGHLESIRAATG